MSDLQESLPSMRTLMACFPEGSLHSWLKELRAMRGEALADGFYRMAYGARTPGWAVYRWASRYGAQLDASDLLHDMGFLRIWNTVGWLVSREPQHAGLAEAVRVAAELHAAFGAGRAEYYAEFFRDFLSDTPPREWLIQPEDLEVRERHIRQEHARACALADQGRLVRSRLATPLGPVYFYGSVSRLSLEPWLEVVEDFRPLEMT